MTRHEPFTLETPAGPTLHGVVDAPAAAGPHPAVVICHGFKGFFEWGFFPHLAELLARRGFTAVRFNFSGTGMAPGDEEVTDLEAFRSATVSRDLDELLAVLDAVAGGTVAPGEVDAGRIGLLGHSRGGGTAVLAAGHPDWRERLGALVTWAAVSHYHRWHADDVETWRRQGEITIVNSRTGQELPLGLEVLHDMEENRQRLDVLAAAARRRAPWLILHGDRDESVPPRDARRLERRAAPPVRLHLVADGGHTFGARHPFTGPDPRLTEALNATQRWFRQYL